MNARRQWLITAVLGVCIELFGASTPVQAKQASSGGGNGRAQTTQAQNGNPPHDSTTASETPSPPLSLADAARKAKLQNSTGQNNGQNTAAKPRVYTNDDLPASRPGPAQTSSTSTPSASAANGAKTSTPAANTGAPNIVIIRFEPEKPTIRRPGGTQMNWMIENHSDHMVTPTVTFIVTGPCNYKSELPTTPEMGAGYGLAHNGFTVAVNESDCAGQYSLELRITFGGKLLASASSSVTVL